MKTSKPDIPGIWEGTLKVGAIEIRLVFKVEKKDDKLTSTMDSPDQGAKDLAVETTKFEGSIITFEMPKYKINYSGEMTADGKSIKGNLKQLGKDYPLDLKRVDKATVINRPQTPKKPFPYKEEEVVVENKKAKDVKLAGTLSLPEGKGPFPAVIMITGSGPQDRDETLFSHKPFAVISDHLTRKGIAVLRCDDRGVAKSTGKHSEATTADFATDIEACFEYLKTRPELDGKKIGLIGHSEGGLIAPMVAAENPDVGFIIMLAGPGVSGSEILLEQGSLIAKAAGQSEILRKWSRERNRKLYAAVKEKADAKELEKIVDESVKSLSEEERKAAESEVKAVKEAIKTLQTPWFRFFLGYDPRPALAKVKCPVLAVNGELDLQVPPKQNLPEIEKALQAGGNKDVTIREFPKLNHLFQKTATGSPSEYGKIEETFSVDVLNAMSEWILKRK